MIVNYKIENENFKITFCPDNQKLSIRKKIISDLYYSSESSSCSPSLLKSEIHEIGVSLSNSFL